MTNFSHLSRVGTALSSAVVLAFGMLLAAPSASADEADLVLYIDREFREELDIQGDGMDVGDITVANGQVSRKRGGKSVGTWTVVAIDASVNLPGGRIDRSATNAIKLKRGSIYMMSVVATNAGAPPSEKNVFAIIGGTGKYSGVRGEMTNTPLSSTRFKYEFYFVD